MRKQPNSNSCFVCGLDNPAGLRVAFYETVSSEGEPELLARFTGRAAHQGYPDRMHGGVATGILDETIGRAINIGSDPDATLWGVAIDLASRFRRPVPLGVELFARGRITSSNRRFFEGSGEIYLPDGTVAVSATARYLKMAPEGLSDLDEATLGWRVVDDDDLEADGRLRS